MSNIHPAFAELEPEVAEAISIPFVTEHSFTIVDESHRWPAEQVIPLAIGVVAVLEDEAEFLAALSQHSTTPYNHVNAFIDEYRWQVGRAHSPIFENKPDDFGDIEMINVIRSNINKIAKDEGHNILGGFLLGLIDSSNDAISGFVVSKKALNTIETSIGQGFDNTKDKLFPNLPSSRETHSDDSSQEDPTHEDLLTTTKELLIPTSLGRQLPKPVAAKNMIISSSPRLKEFYSKSNKAQQKILKAERRASNNFN